MKKRPQAPFEPLPPYTAERFGFAARAYLERFPCSVARFEQVLRTKFQRRKQEVEEEWITAAIAFGLEYGFLDDEKFGEALFEGFKRKGLPAFQIRQKLTLKQLPKEQISSLMQTLPTDTDAQREMVAIFARRKRMGPYRLTQPVDQKERDKKDYEKLRRAGFNHDVVHWLFNEHHPA